MSETILTLTGLSLPLTAANAGLFISPGHGRHPSRRVSFFDLIFVRSGVLGIQEEQTEFTVKPGQSLLLWPDRHHFGTVDYPNDLEFYWIHFARNDSSSIGGQGADFAQPNDARQIDIPQHAAVRRPYQLTEVFRRYLDDQQSGEPMAVNADLLILLILNEVATSPRAGVDVNRQVSTAQTAVLAERAKIYIRSHFHEDISASTVAAAVGCNPNYLARVYRTAYGHTVTDAIHQARMETARRLLIAGHNNVAQISRLCGFDDDGYFRRLFKRTHGMTPVAFSRLYARVHVNTA